MTRSRCRAAVPRPAARAGGMSSVTARPSPSTQSVSLRACAARAIDVEGGRILISRLAGSSQEVRLHPTGQLQRLWPHPSFPVLDRRTGGPPIHFPIVPACRALGIAPVARPDDGAGVPKRRMRLALLVLLRAGGAVEGRSEAIGVVHSRRTRRRSTARSRMRRALSTYRAGRPTSCPNGRRG